MSVHPSVIFFFGQRNTKIHEVARSFNNSPADLEEALLGMVVDVDAADAAGVSKLTVRILAADLASFPLRSDRDDVAICLFYRFVFYIDLSFISILQSELS